MRNNLHLLFLIAVIVFFYSACVKDTDFDQTDDIVLETVLELDFIFFDINSQNFTDLGVNNTIISDTTNLDFLGSEAASENIIRVDFYFRNTNSFPVSLESQYQFLNDNNEIKYELTIPIQDGNINNPVVTEFTEIIENNDLIDFMMATKVVVNTIANTSLNNIDGNLDLQSKATYYLRLEQ